MIGSLLLDRYRPLVNIGAGGMGVVYRARDERLQRDVAIKVLPEGTLADEVARRRFKKEALLLSKLNHPNIETVHDFGSQEGIDFLVMEFIPGTTLDTRLALGTLPDRELLQLAVQLADGLASAHEQGVVHRDLKPGNLRITDDGRLKILDFGLATVLHAPEDLSASMTVSSADLAMGGTMPYMAPEQLRDEGVDARSDLFAAGAVLYEMATGARPFPQTRGPMLIDAILNRQPPAPRTLQPDIAPELEAVILKCLEKDPADRYQSARELGAELRALLEGGPAAAAVAAAASAASRPRQDSAVTGAEGRKITSIAVLPLENRSGDPAQEYFADGMTEALIADLAKIGALRVISRTSVMQFKGARKSLQEIARALRVESVVEGSVMRSGDRVRVIAQLIDTATEAHLWAETYDREARDVLELQSDLARAIAGEIRIKLTPQEQVRLARARAIDPDAHSAYLKGRFHLNKRTADGLKKAIEHFNQAVGIEPEYALAYSGIADAYALLANSGNMPRQDAHPRVKAAALRAVELDDTLGETHTSLAVAHELEWAWPSAEAAFRRAIELNPSYATARHFYATYLTAMGRFEEARQQNRKAQELDPLSLIISHNAGHILYFMRRYDEAIEHFEKLVDMDANFAVAHWTLGSCHNEKGEYEEAIRAFERAAALWGDNTLIRADVGIACARAGRVEEARGILQELVQPAKRRYVSPYQLAALHTSLGERDQALACLERAYEERDFTLISLRVDPAFESLHADASFRDLLQRIGLEGPAAPAAGG